jgi:hypothetical protein
LLLSLCRCSTAYRHIRKMHFRVIVLLVTVTGYSLND